MINSLSFFIKVFIFFLGLCVGSFLNCVIYRLEKNRNLSGRSFCPNCQHQLSWQDLFPVFSYIFLRGKCRYCKKSISWQYPAVELATGLLFLLIFTVSSRANPQASAAIQGFCAQTLDCFVPRLGGVLAMTVMLYIVSALIMIFVYDLKHYIIPDKILLPAIAITFIYRLFEIFEFRILDLFGVWGLSPFGRSTAGGGFGIFVPLGNYLLAVIIASGFFLAIFLASGGRWMGFGDVKLAILMGLLLGFPNILVALFFAFFLGAFLGVFLMSLPARLTGGKKKGLKSQIPFGPFLVAGTFIALFWGQQVIDWYLNSFLFGG